MKLQLDIRKSARENAADYYQLAKEATAKAEGARVAIEQTKRELAESEARSEKEKIAAAPKVRRQKEWYEKFHWFFTSEGFLAIGGRDAAQNDLVVARHMEEGDLFFHADIQGASAVVLKNGKGAGEKSLEEAAQFAAVYSKAWPNRAAAVDVYAVEKGQLSKKVTGGFVGKGGFAIAGERKWFRDTPLELNVGVSESGPVAAPVRSGPDRFKQFVTLVPGDKEKGALARSLAKRFGVDEQEMIQLIPSGLSKIRAQGR